MSTEKQERDYNSLQPHQQRVVDEKSELGQKIIKISEFIDGEIFANLSAKEKHLLKKQLLWMQNYHDILEERINLFFASKEETQDGRDWRTGGEQLIGFFGNEKWDVFALKTTASQFIDETQKRGKDGRRVAIAGTKMEEAQMMAVKSLFN